MTESSADPVNYHCEMESFRLLGMQLVEIDLKSELRKRLFRSRGIAVAVVEPGSEAQRGGIKRGDIVAEVNNVEVESLQEVRALVKRQDPRDPIFIFVFSDDVWRFINLSFISGR